MWMDLKDQPLFIQYCGLVWYGYFQQSTVPQERPVVGPNDHQNGD